jgi:hypothetical protein
MSEDETKIGIRFRLRHLSNVPIEDVYKYFEKRGIIPVYFDEEDNEMYYDPVPCKYMKNTYIQPMIKRDCDTIKSVHVFILFEMYNSYFSYDFGLEDIIEILGKAREEHVIRDSDIRFFGYQWYNGTDEPFYIE